MSDGGEHDANAQALIQAYDQVIGRDPTETEAAVGEQQLQSGVPIGNLRAYLATTGYASIAVQTIYTKALGRAVTAPELASDIRDLAAGGSLGGLLGYLAASTEAANALRAVYAAVLSRQIAAPELAAGRAQLESSYSLAGVRYILATSDTGTAAVQATYHDVSGRAPTPGELIGAEAAIGSGQITLSALRAYFAGTSEAASKLQILYTNELDRAITPGELAGDEGAIANGSSLTAIRGYLSTSTEAVSALGNRYHSIFGQFVTYSDLAAGEQALADGASLQVAALAIPSFITSEYKLLLGVDPDASEIAAVEQQLTGTTAPTQETLFQAVTAVAAASPEFASAINTTFLAALNRSATAAEIASYGAMLSLGTPLAEPDSINIPGTVTLSDLQGQINTLGFQVLYPAELGRAVTASELDNDLRMLSQGATFAKIQGYLSTSTEAAIALLKQYQATFGAPATVGALTGGERALAAGASLQAAVASNPPASASNTSTADAIGLLTLFQKVFKGPESLTDLAASEQALANGASLPAAAVSNTYGLTLIAEAWTRLLGVAPSTADLTSVAQAFAQTAGTTAQPATDANGLQEALNIAAGASATFTNAINASFQTAIGRPANAVELAAYRSELDSGAESSFGQPYDVQPAPTLPALEQQIAQLAAGPSATYQQLAEVAAITPQTIAGVPGYIYGLYDNNALISPSASAETGTGYVGNFNLQTDILQVEISQAASFGALRLTQTNPGQNGSQILFTTIGLAGGAAIELIGVSKSDLLPANFRFV